MREGRREEGFQGGFQGGFCGGGGRSWAEGFDDVVFPFPFLFFGGCGGGCVETDGTGGAVVEDCGAGAVFVFQCWFLL